MEEAEERAVREVFQKASLHQGTKGGLDHAHFHWVGQKLREVILAELDHDRNGHALAEEFATFESADLNKDGVVDWSEFERLLLAALELSGAEAFKKVVRGLAGAMEERRKSSLKLEETMLGDMRKVKVRDAEAHAKRLVEVSKKTRQAVLEVEALHGVVDDIMLELEEIAAANQDAQHGQVTEREFREVLHKHHEAHGVLTDAQIHKVFLMLEGPGHSGVQVAT